MIAANCTPVDDTKSFTIQIYYNIPTTSSLLTRNNLFSNKDKLATLDLVYKYSCNTGHIYGEGPLGHAPLHLPVAWKNLRILHERLNAMYINSS